MDAIAGGMSTLSTCFTRSGAGFVGATPVGVALGVDRAPPQAKKQVTTIRRKIRWILIVAPRCELSRAARCRRDPRASGPPDPSPSSRDPLVTAPLLCSSLFKPRADVRYAVPIEALVKTARAVPDMRSGKQVFSAPIGVVLWQGLD